MKSKVMSNRLKSIVVLLMVAMIPPLEAKGGESDTMYSPIQSPSICQTRSLKMNPTPKKQLRVAVFLHEGIEILDLAAPLEIFTIAGMNVFTVGITDQPVTSQGVLTLTPTYTIENAPKADIVVFLGGNGRRASENAKITDWIKKISPETEQFVSICTGAFFLAESGLLDGKTVTTFHDAVPQLRKKVSNATVLDNTRFVDDGTIFSTAGVSAGIDGALYLVEKWMGKDVAQQVLEYTEYQCWDRDSGLILKH
ncbi:DJ-1/PfpI family protein [Flagellimonas sp.]|jgi:transcriptional regulator GlxA family with amidase domain|uniref:DJ-1/PfpI family protein n=1 Tax=Flagellimonas sp. TaxID=2058762 RepID=UPI000B6D554C|nr:MAG: DJ-1/PfpI family protein [Muricauda sp. TMED12]|tara:strand:+ start:83375 stop:84133 length:759 start_codon:yes stop_codon:yes gene_type:complete